MSRLLPHVQGSLVSGPLLFAAFAGAAAAQDPVEPPPIHEPWRMTKALGLPEWFSISGQLRARYEAVDERLFAGLSGENHGIFTRALVLMTIQDEFLEASVEMIDARIFGEPDDALPTTGQVNAVEVLQGYVAGRFTDSFQPNDSLRVQVGRHTMDVGSRRLVARNRYRNTINAFTGANAQWTASNGAFVRAFYTHPVVRLPADGEFERLAANEVEFDEARSTRRFWGTFAKFPSVALETNVELYYYGLLESDGRDLITRDRDLDTFGTRWVRNPRRGGVDWEIEAAVQTGKSAKLLSSSVRLDHDASFVHLSAGYTFDTAELPRIEALFDYASGDDDPNDGKNGRFDSLFGVPRMEFGPTGLFRAITRSNIISPGVRFSMNPGEKWELLLMQRFNYLAADRDVWTTTGIVDPTGQSGDHIGDLSELRVRYHPYGNKAVRHEFGVAYLSAGGFSKNAPNGDGQDSLYGYVQTLFWF